MFKAIVVIAFIVILFSLGSALFHLIKRNENEQSDKTVKALTWRIGLSLALFVLVFALYATGLIKPEGIGARMQQIQQSHPQP